MTRNEVIDAIVEALTDQEKAVKKATIRQHQKIGAGAGATFGLGRALLPYATGEIKRQRKGMYRGARFAQKMLGDAPMPWGMQDVERNGPVGARKVVRAMAKGQNTMVPVIAGIHGGVGALVGSVTGRIHAAHKIRKMRKAAQ